MRLSAKGYIIGGIVVLAFYLAMTFGFAKMAMNVSKQCEQHYIDAASILQENK